MVTVCVFAGYVWAQSVTATKCLLIETKSDVNLSRCIQYKKPLLHDQFFFDKIHVSLMYFDLVNEDFLTSLFKLHGQKTLDT